MAVPVSVRVEFADPADVVRCVEALLEHADAIAQDAPLLARRCRAIADQLGDELDGLPVPSGIHRGVSRETGSRALTD
ncbi:MAG: hypothetical protein BGO38_07930 [Cellulomonas sp. 73-145]|uniref:hypothetical protein n=1 Tax=Cellulomonas sp. 73-145 TaxID=1895739 RepID=UPI0009295814|nr:hypothetical protein [Cellulomonas sp. 73-145]OJV58121.1 MAG: hypothetical protein BGO38_07930 [Cellulomonas sp. 73-145]